MKPLVEDLRDVFDENVGDRFVSWDVAAANYQDYGSVSLFKDWLERGVTLFNK